MSIEDGGPAFPTAGNDFAAPGPDGAVHPKSAFGFEGASGMSLRDYFAAHVVGQMIARYWTRAAGDLDPMTPGGIAANVTSAYKYADAMLAERAKAEKREVKP